MESSVRELSNDIESIKSYSEVDGGDVNRIVVRGQLILIT